MEAFAIGDDLVDCPSTKRNIRTVAEVTNPLENMDACANISKVAK